jgi:hypothetical protein
MLPSGYAHPFPVTTAKNDPVLRELARLGVATPIPPKTVKQGRAEVELSESERIQVAQQEGELLYRRAPAAFSTDFWRTLPDNQHLTRVPQTLSEAMAKYDYEQ